MAETATDTVSAPDLGMGEISASSTSLDVTRHYLGPVREISDSVLMSLGERWQAYRDLRRDGQVHATFQQRRLAIVSRPLVVEPGAEDALSIAAADQLRANLAAINFDRACKMMAWGFFYGMSQAECMWQLRDGKIWLDRAKVRTPWRFRYTDEGELRLLTKSQPVSGIIMPARKFWSMSAGADNDDEPYGLGLAHQLYWPVQFRKHGIGFWLKALEKYGGPTAVVRYPAGMPPEDVRKALQAAQAARSDGAVAIPTSLELELLEALKGTVDQATFHRQMSGEVAKIVLGQTMTTDDGASLSQSQTHMGVREELTDADSEDLCESFQTGPATWLTQWNFPGAATPILKRPSVEDQAQAADLASKRATTLQVMTEAGYEPEPDTVTTLYPGWRKASPPPAAQKVKPPIGVAADNVIPLGSAFAEPTSGPADAIDAYAESLDWEPAVLPMVEAIRRHILASPTLEAAAATMDAVFADESGQAAQAMFTSATFQARLAGLFGIPLSDGEAKVLKAGE